MTDDIGAIHHVSGIPPAVIAQLELPQFSPAIAIGPKQSTNNAEDNKYFTFLIFTVPLEI
jgi:hypothetical protein